MSQDPFWLILRAPRCVPLTKGPWPRKMLKGVLIEFMAARPGEFITVLTIQDGVPMVEDAPDQLTMLDLRHRGRARQHRTSTDLAFADHSQGVRRA